MADSNVVTHARFGATERLKELQEQGVIVVEETRAYTDIDLPEPGYGEQIIGELEPSEKAMFFAMYDATTELEDTARTLMGRQIAKLGEAVRDSDRSKPLHEAMADGEIKMNFESDDEARAFYRLEKRAAMLHSTLHWNLAERFDRHEFKLGVRSRGRVVATEKRY